MLEAVNSVISNAPFLRPNAEQASSARIALDEATVSAPQAPYVSPYIHVNNDYNKAVLQIRDSDTGDVLKQFPSEQTLAARQRQAEAQRQIERVEQAELSGASSDQGAAQSTNTYTEAQIVSSDYQPQSAPSRAPSADAVSAAIVSASQSGAQASSGVNVSVQA